MIGCFGGGVSFVCRIQELKRKENERLAEAVTIKKRENGLKAKIERLKAKQSAK